MVVLVVKIVVYISSPSSRMSVQPGRAKQREEKKMAVRHTATATLPYLIRGFGKESSTLRRPLPSLRRAFSLYDQINLIDQVPEDQLRFQGYTATGFTVNGVDYEGSLLCIGNLLMSWTPKTFSDITPESLSIFKLIRPIPGEPPTDIIYNLAALGALIYVALYTLDHTPWKLLPIAFTS